MYDSYQYINKLVQFDSLDCSLIIIDSTGLLEEVRIEKNFEYPMSDEALDIIAQNHIRILNGG